MPGVPKEPASTDCPYAYPDASGGIVGSGGAGCLVFPASAGAVPDDAKVPGAVNEAAGVTVELYESYDSYGLDEANDEADNESDDEAAGLFVPRLSSCWSLSYPCCALPVFSWVKNSAFAFSCVYPSAGVAVFLMLLSLAASCSCRIRSI